MYNSGDPSDAGGIVKQKYSSFIFDLDGTISDPSLGITRCFNYALKKQGHAARDDAMLKTLIGPPLDEGFKILVPSADTNDLKNLVVAYRERYRALGFAENVLYPGIVEALQTLKEKGARLGICTSKRKDFAEKILDLFHISDFFDFVSGGDVGISKSSQLADLMKDGAIDLRALMIGDRAVDIKSAKANGLGAVGVLWGFGDHQELAAVKPLTILETTCEITGLMK